MPLHNYCIKLLHFQESCFNERFGLKKKLVL